MAGEAVLSAFMQVMFDKAFTAAGSELSLVRGAKKELTKLSSTLRTIRSVLEDAEERQIKDAAVRDWLRRLKALCYDAGNVLDLYEAEALRWEIERADAKVGGCFSVPCYCSSQFGFNVKIARRIKTIREELDDIAKERDSLGLCEFGGTSRLEITERLPTSSLVDDSYVFGREEDKEKMVKLLLSDSRANFSVISVVGMGGLGKTTLAQLLYNDKRVEDYFQMRTWVCVSDSFDISKVTKEIAECVTVVNHEGQTTTNMTTFTNLNLVQENLMIKLKAKRFLLVLDDVWNDDFGKWQMLVSPLRCGAKGSKVHCIHRLEGLSESDCWQLFKRFAFVDGGCSKYPKLEEIGKEIVKKLKGFPLAAKTLGGLLYSKLDAYDWYNILRSEIWELPPDKNSILPALRLSYQHLPPHLKQCFVYCSVFHKDYIFRKEDLIRIWMALGFVQPQGRRRLEDVANEYFDDLVCMSFFQHHGDNYVMHDMFHDLAQSISVDECYRMEDNKNCYFPEKIRHLSVSFGHSVPTKFETFYGFKSLLSLLLLRGYKSPISEVPHSLFLKLRYLRVLVLQRRNIKELPSSIGCLKLLRYLSLAGTSIKSLPSSIGTLYNLQTLNLKNCDVLDYLPRGMSLLKNLRHLEATTRLVSMIYGIGKLTCLQELEEYIVLKEKGHRIGELKDMTELRGKLCIQNLGNVMEEAEATEAKIHEKTYLDVLELIWADDAYSPGNDIHERVLEVLRPHVNLKELKIKGYEGLKFPRWMGNSLLSNLQNIFLVNCRRCEFLPPLGQLPFLRALLVEGMDGVKQMSNELYGEGHIKGFPMLEELVIVDMICLEEWHGQQDDKVFPFLHEVQIEDCPQLSSLPFLPPTLTRLRISEVGILSLPGIRSCNESEEEKRLSLEALLPSEPLSLSYLHISECPKLISLRWGLLAYQLNFLEDLTIRGCENLCSLPSEGFKVFVSLKNLHIYNCPKLVASSNETIFPTSLRDLRIHSCSSLINEMLLLELKNLSSLVHFEIANCAVLVSLPEEVLPINLEFLGIFNCAKLQFLPAMLHKVSFLKTLIISNCPEMRSLSSEGLPSLLQELFVNKCPFLKARYQKGGRDWHVIEHVPKIDFDEEEIIYETAKP